MTRQEFLGRAPELHRLMSETFADPALPGAVWLVAEGERVQAGTVGVRASGTAEPMARDSLFRIASMTKAVTSAAAMMLKEEGKLAFDAPAERWLPELADRRVLARIDAELDDTVPAQRAITVQDLMDGTLGFGILFRSDLPIARRIDELQLVNGAPTPMTPHDPDEWMRRFATLPLMHQPGAQWMYNTASLIQGVLVARASGQRFDDFVRERILGPLGMADTDFYVPADKLARLAGCGVYTNQAGAQVRMDGDGPASAYATPPVFPSGAGGLVSTADDYLAFARMLSNRGVHGGRRLLSEASVAEMTRDHLSAGQKAASSFMPGFFDTRGWGYGVAVHVTPDAVSPNPGRYGWDGGFGTSFVVDPAQGMIAVVMSQSTDFLFGGSLQRFWRTLYGATDA